MFSNPLAFVITRELKAKVLGVKQEIAKFHPTESAHSGHSVPKSIIAPEEGHGEDL